MRKKCNSPQCSPAMFARNVHPHPCLARVVLGVEPGQKVVVHGDDSLSGLSPSLLSNHNDSQDHSLSFESSDRAQAYMVAVTPLKKVT